jgi:hypothetical protein
MAEHPPHHGHHGASLDSNRHAGATTVLTVPTGLIACEGCRAIVEERLWRSPHVLEVHVDAPHRAAHVEVREGTVSADELAELVAGAY